MEPIPEDHLISYKLKESNGNSSHQMDKVRDENVQFGLNTDLDSVKHNQLQCGLNANLDSVRHKHLQCDLNADLDSVRHKQLQCGFNADLDSFRHKHESFFDMLLWLQSVARGHYMENSSSRNPRKSWRQILNARKVLSLSHDEAPWRKRKLNQLLQETARSASKSNLRPGKPNERSLTKRGNYSIASSSSCVTNYAYYERNSDWIHNTHTSVRSLQFGVPNGHSFQADAFERFSPSETEDLPVFDSDDSVCGSNLSISTNPLIQATHQRPIKLLKSGNNDPRKQVRISPYPDDYVKGSNSSSSKKAWKHETPPKPAKLFDFIGDYLPRMAIPVGPRFQAEIPDLIGLPYRASPTDVDVNFDDSKKWLGTQIWPIEGINAETSREVIGKGRPYSCSCNSPGSIQCIRLHVTEKRLQLQFDLSSAFFSWKFDEMGEEVSKLWTPAEEKSFRILVKTNPVSKNLTFWEPALKCFPSKPRPSIASYYFNVFVLGRMSRQTRLAPEVDSDDDEIDDEGVGQSKEGQSKAVKQRYLTGLR